MCSLVQVAVCTTAHCSPCSQHGAGDRGEMQDHGTWQSRSVLFTHLDPAFGVGGQRASAGCTSLAMLTPPSMGGEKGHS